MPQMPLLQIRGAGFFFGARVPFGGKRRVRNCGMNDAGNDLHVTPEENCFDLLGRFVAGSEGDTTRFNERVALRAYYLYMDAAAVQGYDVNQWLLAEWQERQIIEKAS